MSIRPAVALAALLGGAGTVHLVAPRIFDPMVPGRLPGPPRFWTVVSGLAELGVAAAVAAPRTRRLGGTLAAALFVAVFPANIKMALDLRDHPPGVRFAATARLPLQVPLILWALGVRRSAIGGAQSGSVPEG